MKDKPLNFNCKTIRLGLVHCEQLENRRQLFQSLLFGRTVVTMGQLESKLPANLPRAVKYLQRTKSNASNFDDITRLYERLRRDTEMTRETFSKYFNYDKKTQDHIFEVFDKNDGVLDRDEFIRGITMCSVGNLDEKINLL